MNCPFATAPAVASAPLAGPLTAAYPRAINQRYRSIEDTALVRQILAKATDFTPANALSTAVTLSPAALRILAAARFALPPVLASATGAAHMRVRRVVAGFFSPGKVRGQQEVILRRVAELCEPLRGAYLAGENVDLAETIAAIIPAEIMHNLTGIPVPPTDLLKRWSQDSLELFWGWPDEPRQLVLAASAAEFFSWLVKAVNKSVQRNDGNLYAALHEAGIEKPKIISLGYFLAIAGQETTTMLIQSALFSALRDGHWEPCADPETDERTAGKVVKQVLATASSVPTWRRITATDVVVNGEPFGSGEELVLRLSGGIQGSAFDDSLAFGFGIHRCLGAGLARMETELVLKATARALPGIELVDRDPRWNHLLSFQAPHEVRTRATGHEGKSVYVGEPR
ncbi:cytochrome P450 [Arthrobacter sp. MYb227]|uniref:cytochrome P450 n=1 Tax=Arthrobacter sp. MYb227 TaxID=1848601 RepID=UPI0015E2B523|nr:cytochrome P450 [Arthrobacter sp. MYb227]